MHLKMLLGENIIGDMMVNCNTYCHHCSPQLESSQSLLVLCFLWSLLAVLELDALLVVLPSGWAASLSLFVMEPADDTVCDDNRVPAGFSIDGLDDVCW